MASDKKKKEIKEIESLWQMRCDTLVRFCIATIKKERDIHYLRHKSVQDPVTEFADRLILEIQKGTANGTPTSK